MMVEKFKGLLWMFYKLWYKECSKESAYVWVAESMVNSQQSTVYGQ